MRHIFDIDWCCTDVLGLSRVCRLWRDIAERCTILWHQFSISPATSHSPWSSHPKTIRPTRLVQKYLINSCQAPLDIIIHFPGLEDYGWKPHGVVASMYRAFEEIIKHAHRWRSIKLLVDEDCDRCVDNATRICIHQVANMLWKGGALLEARRLELLHICLTSDVNYNSQHFQNCSTNSIEIVSTYLLQLRHLRLDSFVGAIPSKMLEHVTDLSIGDTCRHPLSVSSTLAILDNCANLVHLTIRYMPSAAHQADVKQLSNLKTIRFIDVAWPNRALGWVSAPALQTIEVSSKRRHTSEILSYASVVQLMGSETHLSQICHLDFSGANVKNDSLQRLLASCMHASRIIFRASTKDEARTGVLQDLRESMPERMGGVDGNTVHITITEWLGAGKAYRSANTEFLRLKRNCTKFSAPADFIFKCW